MVTSTARQAEKFLGVLLYSVPKDSGDMKAIFDACMCGFWGWDLCNFQSRPYQPPAVFMLFFNLSIRKLWVKLQKKFLIIKTMFCICAFPPPPDTSHFTKTLL